MTFINQKPAIMRRILFILCLFNALSAIPSGGLLMLNPDGRIFHFPPDLLETTPFQNYFVPGILLAMIVGGSSLMAAISLFKNTRYQYWLAMSAGLILIGWIFIQTILIQSVHWLHAAYFILGFTVLLLSVALIKQAKKARV